MRPLRGSARATTLLAIIVAGAVLVYVLAANNGSRQQHASAQEEASFDGSRKALHSADSKSKKQKGSDDEEDYPEDDPDEDEDYEDFFSCSCRHLPDKTFKKKKSKLQSLCSDEATRRGRGQRIVSYSFFGDWRTKNGELNWFAKGLVENAELLPRFYGPNWVMRVYHDEPGLDLEKLEFLCSVKCNFTHVDLCYVGDIPSKGNFESFLPTTWRFLPLGDPLVDVMHSRDLDSRPSEREMAAVAEFHVSKAMFHVMRDHKQHRTEILAGLWGAKPIKNRAMGRKLLKAIMKAVEDETFDKNTRTMDQKVLTDYLYPYLGGQSLVHDSYHCGHYRVSETRAFPTQRKEDEGYNFVGAQMYGNKNPVLEVCPPPCRPKNHKDWMYC